MKGACTALKTSAGSDPLTEFNRALHPAVISRKVSQCSKNACAADAFAAFTSIIRTLIQTEANSVKGDSCDLPSSS